MYSVSADNHLFFFGIYGHNKFITLFFLQLVSSSVGKKRFILRCTISMGHNSLKVSVTRTSQQFRTRLVSKVQNRPNSFQFSILLFLLWFFARDKSWSFRGKRLVLHYHAVDIWNTVPPFNWFVFFDNTYHLVHDSIFRDNLSTKET